MELEPQAGTTPSPVPIPISVVSGEEQEFPGVPSHSETSHSTLRLLLNNRGQQLDITKQSQGQWSTNHGINSKTCVGSSASFLNDLRESSGIWERVNSSMKDFAEQPQKVGETKLFDLKPNQLHLEARMELPEDIMGANPETNANHSSSSTLPKFGLRSVNTELPILAKNNEQSKRCASLIQRIRVLQEEAIESHIRQQLSTMIRETGMDPNLLPIIEDKVVVQEEGRRRKSVSVSSCGTTYTYGNDDGGDGLSELQSPPTTKPAPPKPLSLRDLHQLERMVSLLSMTLDERETMPSAMPSNEDDTESSSDCCSDDDDCYKKPEVIYNYLPVEDNPETKWACDRAQLVCMWTWIKDAIANVTHHIRQQDEIYEHIKLRKTPIQFGQPASAPIPHDLGSNSSNLKDAIVEVYKSENGTPPVTYLHANSEVSAGKTNSLSSTNSKNVISDDRAEIKDRIRIGGGLGNLNIDFGTTSDEGSTSRRCLPLQAMKRRKIYHLGGIKNTTFQGKTCSCFGKVELCTLCLSRSNKPKLIDCSVMMGREIVAHLDYCSHESLSLRDETRIDLMMDSSLKLGTWKKSREQRRYNFLPFTHLKHGTGGSEIKSEFGDDLNGEKSEKRGRGRPRLMSDKPKLEEPKKKYNTAARKLARMQRAGGYGERVKPLIARSKFKKRKHTKSKSFSKIKHNADDDMDDYDSLTGDIEDYSWRPAALQGKLKKERTTSSSDVYKRNRNQDYDIDNIVIPYSIASATRVEKIEYKEIITPSWRTIQEDLVKKSIGGEDSGSDQEDMGEQTIIARHDRSEVEEHKKFSVAPSSSRRGRRTDSKTENFDTPDAMSPLMLDVNVNSIGGDTLPPSPTAGGFSEDQPNLHMTAADASLALTALKFGSSISTRRRTTSLSKKAEEEVQQYVIEEEDGIMAFGPRKFPLDDTDYEEMLQEMPDDFLLSPPKADQDLQKPDLDDDEMVETESMDFSTTRLSSPQSDKEDDDSSNAEDDPDWECVDGER